MPLMCCRLPCLHAFYWMYLPGDRLKEATKINLSLSALGNVISALVDGKSGTALPWQPPTACQAYKHCLRQPLWL